MTVALDSTRHTEPFSIQLVEDTERMDEAEAHERRACDIAPFAAAWLDADLAIDVCGEAFANACAVPHGAIAGRAWPELVHAEHRLALRSAAVEARREGLSSVVLRHQGAATTQRALLVWVDGGYFAAVFRDLGGPTGRRPPRRRVDQMLVDSIDLAFRENAERIAGGLEPLVVRCKLARQLELVADASPGPVRCDLDGPRRGDLCSIDLFRTIHQALDAIGDATTSDPQVTVRLGTDELDHDWVRIDMAVNGGCSETAVTADFELPRQDGQMDARPLSARLVIDGGGLGLWVRIPD